MPGPLGAFAAFVLIRLARAVRIGTGLGAGFGNIPFMNALKAEFPELAFSQIGALASAAIWAGKAGFSQLGLPPPGVIASELVPSLEGLSGIIGTGNKFRYLVEINYTVEGFAAMLGFRTIVDSPSLVDTATLASLALAALADAVTDSPDAFDFGVDEISGGEAVLINYIIQRT